MIQILITYSLILLSLSVNPPIARLHYQGGGDWYNDPDILPNLIHFINNTLGTNYKEENIVVTPDSPELFNYPIIFITGHGNIVFNDKEAKNIRKYLINGGTLYIDDDYGLDKYIRRELKKIFPDKELKPLPKSSDLFHIYYDFQGLPQIHKHYEGSPVCYAIFIGKRPVILYTYNSNISDGWNDPSVYNDPPELCEKALKMGLNIVLYLIYGEENGSKNQIIH